MKVLVRMEVFKGICMLILLLFFHMTVPYILLLRLYKHYPVYTIGYVHLNI